MTRSVLARLVTVVSAPLLGLVCARLGVAWACRLAALLFGALPAAGLLLRIYSHGGAPRVQAPAPRMGVIPPPTPTRGRHKLHEE